MDSKTIFREIQNKNHFVFKRLFEGLYPELVNYANEYLFDKDSSEDVVQEVFVYLWEKSNSINLKTNLKAYLYAMVRNRCLNTLKAIKITDISKILITKASYSPDFFPEEEKHVRHEQIRNVIENLPTKMRAIVMLRFINNYPYKEIARELGVSTNTVKTQLKRAKVRLGELIIYIGLLFSTM
ncbi:RNA polymerase sigma factor [Kriegella aquimaris]|uniref:RNA polymerase sigma-70 factor, ECF subfamily n=1 Tax=Kriegella aquimaris TaxID=192904 RepID=A0A1G9S6G5_9FLAO|nr:RNA polymerase sigma-70 factor [Kriegella aquimaris]SDM31099.1 RNA polymerase sigma-70 factor, ECF subfamily [Kriegella aquimaris]